MPVLRRHAAVLAVVLASALTAARARAQACDAGTGCVDRDGDGFPACPCASADACDCDDRDPLTFPRAPESCDAVVDRNCNGVAGEACGDAGCLAGLCVPACIPLDDFGCEVGSQCVHTPAGERLCQPRDCTTFGCTPGEVCNDEKRCVPLCHPGVVCPRDQICRGGACVDPCEGVRCADGATCARGLCIASCACAGGGCAPGETCDVTSAVPRCVDDGCAGVACPDGAHCARGACVDDCEGVVCPTERLCKKVVVDGGVRGACVDLCSPTACALPYVCDWRTGGCLPPTFRDAGLEVPVTGIEDGLVLGGGAWSCTAGAFGGASAATALGAVGVVGFCALRRRRRARCPGTCSISRS